jgi:hypothetical protein
MADVKAPEVVVNEETGETGKAYKIATGLQ